LNSKEEAEDKMRFVFNDGGRIASGYKGSAGDCVTRTIAIATGKPYSEVFADLNSLAAFERIGRRKKRASNSNSGIYRRTYDRYLKALGWRWTSTMSIGSGCKVHLRASELPKGILVVRVSRHLTAVIDGVIHDTHDCSRAGARCVYGYFSPPPVNQTLTPIKGMSYAYRSRRDGSRVLRDPDQIAA
jgi:hypothetical protein